MSDSHISWIAGIYEGEGCINTHFFAPSRGTKQQRHIRCHLDQKDTWMLYKAKEVLVDYVGIPADSIKIYERPGKVSRLSITKFDNVDKFMTAIWSWLSPRRKEQAIHALVTYCDAGTGDSELTYEMPTDTFPSLRRVV